MFLGTSNWTPYIVIHIKVFLLVFSTLYAQQFFQHGIKFLQIAGEILLKRLVVIADALKHLALHHDIFVVAAITIFKSLLEVLRVILHGQSFLLLTRFMALSMRPSSIVSAKKGIM